MQQYIHIYIEQTIVTISADFLHLVSLLTKTKELLQDQT